MKTLLPAVETVSVLRERLRDEVLDRPCLLCRKPLRKHRGLKDFHFDNDTRRYALRYVCGDFAVNTAKAVSE